MPCPKYLALRAAASAGIRGSNIRDDILEAVDRHLSSYCAHPLFDMLKSTVRDTSPVGPWLCQPERPEGMLQSYQEPAEERYLQSLS